MLIVSFLVSLLGAAPAPQMSLAAGVERPLQLLLVADKTFSCSVRKTKCGQMDSCEEAIFYLTQCGVRSLDGDKDGVPCESLCG